MCGDAEQQDRDLDHRFSNTPGNKTSENSKVLNYAGDCQFFKLLWMAYVGFRWQDHLCGIHPHCRQLQQFTDLGCFGVQGNSGYRMCLEDLSVWG